jgi:hypothetical protein
MITKSLIAAAAVAASITAFAPAQQAQAGVDIDVNLGFGGYYPGYGYGYYPAYTPYYGAISCQKGKKIVKWSGYHNVNAVDCSLPGYKYTGWKWGHKYLVRVNGGGNITGKQMLF